jgi:hypothetical protein
MVDLRINGMIAGAAFLISLLVGSLSGGMFLIVLFRALVFALIFFVITGGINLAVSCFLPELFDMKDNERPGSHIDVTVEDEESSAAFPDEDSGEEVGNIGQLVGQEYEVEEGASENITEGAGLDQADKNRYTNTRAGVDPSFLDNKSNREPRVAASSLTEGQNFQPAIPSRSSEDADSVDILPDLEDMAKAFLPPEGGDEQESGIEDAPQKKPSAKGKSLAGDFNPKDMAQALQTILKRDE